MKRFYDLKDNQFLQTGTTALFFAAQGGFLEVVKILIEAGSLIDCPSIVSNIERFYFS